MISLICFDLFLTPNSKVKVERLFHQNKKLQWKNCLQRLNNFQNNTNTREIVAVFNSYLTLSMAISNPFDELNIVCKLTHCCPPPSFTPFNNLRNFSRASSIISCLLFLKISPNLYKDSVETTSSQDLRNVFLWKYIINSVYRPLIFRRLNKLRLWQESVRKTCAIRPILVIF